MSDISGIIAGGAIGILSSLITTIINKYDD